MRHTVRFLSEEKLISEKSRLVKYYSIWPDFLGCSALPLSDHPLFSNAMTFAKLPSCLKLSVVHESRAEDRSVAAVLKKIKWCLAAGLGVGFVEDGILKGQLGVPLTVYPWYL